MYNIPAHKSSSEFFYEKKVNVSNLASIYLLTVSPNLVKTEIMFYLHFCPFMVNFTVRCDG